MANQTPTRTPLKTLIEEMTAEQDRMLAIDFDIASLEPHEIRAGLMGVGAYRLVVFRLYQDLGIIKQLTLEYIASNKSEMAEGARRDLMGSIVNINLDELRNAAPEAALMIDEVKARIDEIGKPLRTHKDPSGAISRAGPFHAALRW